MHAHSFLSSRRGWLKAVVGVSAGAAIDGFGLLPRGAHAQGTSTVYPIQPWLAAQGQSFGQIPPSANFADWFSRLAPLHNAPMPTPLVATFDYAGLENKAFNNAFGTTIDTTNSKAMVQPLTDGSGNVQVRVLLYTKNANTWVIQLTNLPGNGQLPPDFSTQLVTNKELFGFRPYPSSSVTPTGVCLGDCFLDITYITTANNLWVDLVTFLSSPGLQRAAFRAQATGPLTPYYSSLYGVPQGTQGRCTVSETGLLDIQTNPNSRIALDGFPAEVIDLHPLG
ncbi:hypothetical protein [Paraburkholderia youngii]|uniref:hypothetical protein n=1 Tax=Paraburkholderia youngii TaxID=2782701 RepID=UPI001596003B|nr:hypothetical protein [Paraburkholderia youngii]